jgi:hypothetical protein
LGNLIPSYLVLSHVVEKVIGQDLEQCDIVSREEHEETESDQYERVEEK